MDRKGVIAIIIVVIVVIAGIGVVLTSGGEARDTDTMYIGVRTDASTWDHSGFPDGDGRFLWSQCYETLVRLDGGLEYVPGLATSWEPTEDLREWTFHLREGVTFHDGTPMDADAVVFSYNESSYVRNGPLAALTSVIAIDEVTVLFTSATPIELPGYLTHVAWPVMAPSSVGDDGRITEPIGTGPYMYEGSEDDVQTTFVRNDGYWDADRMPTLERIVFRVIPDVSTRIMALQSDIDRLDMAIGIPEDRIAELDGDDGVEVNEAVSTFTDFVQFNTLSAPFDDIDVRRAVAYSIDCDLLVDSLMDGHGTAAWGSPLSPVMEYYDESLDKYSLDREEAASLLDGAGWVMGDDGIRHRGDESLSITLLVEMTQAAAPRFGLMAQSIASQLGEVGFDVSLVTNSQDFQEREADGDFGMILRTGYFVWGPYPKHFLLHTSFFPFSHYANGTYNGMVTGADDVDGDVERANYEALQSWVVDQLPAYYTAHTNKIVVTRSYVDGYSIATEWPWLDLSGVSIEA